MAEKTKTNTYFHIWSGHIKWEMYLCANYFAKCATNLSRNMNVIGITWLIFIFPQLKWGHEGLFCNIHVTEQISCTFCEIVYVNGLQSWVWCISPVTFYQNNINYYPWFFLIRPGTHLAKLMWIQQVFYSKLTEMSQNSRGLSGGYALCVNVTT